MRCTKCSFISFDDLSACAKCATDLSKLSKELNGTCTESRLEFFLGSAIQTPGADEDNLSDSQMLPPIATGDMNFDDTSTGGLSTPSFDDTASVTAEDDVAIELGDIMPIDFGQLDTDPVLSAETLENTDSLNLDNFNFDLDKTDAISPPADNRIDPDSTLSFSESTDDLQFDGDLADLDMGDLSQDIPVVLADQDSPSLDDALAVGGLPEDGVLDFDGDLFDQLDDSSANLDETLSLKEDISLDDTQIAFEPIAEHPDAPLELDESLVAELAGPTSLDVSGEFSMDFSDTHSASGDFELDAALVAELAGGDAGGAKDPEDVFSTTGNFSADSIDLNEPLEFTHAAKVSEEISFDQIEDLTGEFAPIRAEEADLAELDLTDIDVSDLLDTSDNQAAADDTQNQFVAQAEPVLPNVDDTISELVGNREDLSLDLSQELSIEEEAPKAPPSSVDDTIREEAAGNRVSVDDTIREESGSLKFEPLDIQVEDEVILEFDGDFLNGAAGGTDDTKDSDDDLLDLAAEIDLPEGSAPQDFSSSLLDDTFREGEPIDVSFATSKEDPADDLLDEELVLDSAVEDGDSLSADIDALALDTDFEAFLNKTGSGEENQGIDLVSDDDDEEPPALPS